MSTLKTKYWLLKIGKRLDQMITEFKKHIPPKLFHECDLGNASKVFKVVSSSIIQSASMLQADITKSSTDPSKLSTLITANTGSIVKRT
jgi:hypothetical protein